MTRFIFTYVDILCMKSEITFESRLNVDMDNFLNIVEEEFKSEYLLKEDFKAFHYVIDYLKRVDWSDYTFPDSLFDVLDTTYYTKYRRLCKSCPHQTYKRDDDEDCVYYERCGAGDVLDVFIEYVENNMDSLIEKYKEKY